MGQRDAACSSCAGCASSGPNVAGCRLLGYGFAMPYLRAFLPEAERCIAAMPAAMGVSAPGRRANASPPWCEEDALPFPDAFFDRILMVHGLEEAEGLRPLLRQLWRVLAPEGRLLMVAPNRASLWAQVERSPFGHGRPFSRGELDAPAARRAVRAGALAARALCAAACKPGAGRQRRGLGDGSARGFFPAWAACIWSKRPSRFTRRPRPRRCAAQGARLRARSRRSG